MVDLEGHFTALTDDYRNVRGLAWSADGSEVWFTAGGWRANRALRAVSRTGRVRDVFAAPSSLTLWDIASDGRVLLTHEEETRGVMGRSPGAAAERDLSYHDSSGLASLSPDGRWILMGDQFGLYLRATDDESPLTDLGLVETYGDDVNNARTVVATAAAGSQLLLLPWGSSLPRTLPAHGISAYYGAMLFPDGRRLLFNGSMAKEGIRAFVQKIDSGAPEPLTPLGTKALAISPDGQWVAATRSDPGIWLYPVSGEEPPRPVAARETIGRRPGAPTARPSGYSGATPSPRASSAWISRADSGSSGRPDPARPRGCVLDPAVQDDARGRRVLLRLHARPLAVSTWRAACAEGRASPGESRPGQKSKRRPSRGRAEAVRPRSSGRTGPRSHPLPPRCRCPGG